MVTIIRRASDTIHINWPSVQQVKQWVRETDKEKRENEEEPDNPACDVKDNIDNNSKLLDNT